MAEILDAEDTRQDTTRTQHETTDAPEIRELTTRELTGTSARLQTYGFFASPGDGAAMHDLAPYRAGDLTLAVTQGGESLAEAAAIPMRQNVRGLVVDMAGLTGATSHPLARRQGHMRRLVHRLLGQMRDRGCVLACLYPFRPSFWQRFGFVGLPRIRTTTFRPGGLAPLLVADLPGEVSVRTIGAGYDDYRGLQHWMLTTRHGFALFPDVRAVRLRDSDNQWLATVQTGGEVTGALLYRVTGFDADLTVSAMVARDRFSRAALLRYLALHTDQVARVVLPLDPEELPELWASDLEPHTEASVRLPGTPAAMARVLSLPGLAGLPVGPGRLTVRLVDDPFLAGDHVLDGTTGGLEISAAPAGGQPDAVLTAPGLSGLVYGVLDPDDVVIRGLGSVRGPAAEQARLLFPRRLPYLSAAF